MAEQWHVCWPWSLSPSTVYCTRRSAGGSCSVQGTAWRSRVRFWCAPPPYPNATDLLPAQPASQPAQCPPAQDGFATSLCKVLALRVAQPLFVAGLNLHNRDLPAECERHPVSLGPIKHDPNLASGLLILGHLTHPPRRNRFGCAQLAHCHCTLSCALHSMLILSCGIDWRKYSQILREICEVLLLFPVDIPVSFRHPFLLFGSQFVDITDRQWVFTLKQEEY